MAAKNVIPMRARTLMDVAASLFLSGYRLASTLSCARHTTADAIDVADCRAPGPRYIPQV
jgi:hypothetical protein